MLALTEHAAKTIEALLRAPGLPAGAGVRITPANSKVSSAEDLRVVMAREPHPDDQVITNADPRVRVFIDGEVTDFLEDKLLDAELIDDRVRFSLDGRSSTRQTRTPTLGT